MIKKVAALVLVAAAAVAVTAAAYAGTAPHRISTEQQCTAALNADVDAFVQDPNAVQNPTSNAVCDRLSERTNTELFYRVEQARSTDIANAQLKIGN